MHVPERRSCYGILQCPSAGSAAGTTSRCKYVQRPKTNASSVNKQLAERPCPHCHQPLVWIRCDVRAAHYTIDRDGDTVDIWEQLGHHTHSRPPLDGHIPIHHMVALDAQILRRPDATAHQLRTGDMAPGSVPLPSITPALADPHRARYQVQKGRSRLGLHPSSVTTATTSVLQSLASLNKELGSTFLVDSGFVDRAYVVMQTPFMKRLVGEAVEDWLTNSADGPDAGRHGFMTDGDHTFFSHGVLLVTAGFSRYTASWQPLLYTWISGLGTDDHCPHFHHLNSSIVQGAGECFEPKLLSAVRHDAVHNVVYYLMLYTIIPF